MFTLLSFFVLWMIVSSRGSRAQNQNGRVVNNVLSATSSCSSSLDVSACVHRYLGSRLEEGVLVDPRGVDVLGGRSHRDKAVSMLDRNLEPKFSVSNRTQSPRFPQRPCFAFVCQGDARFEPMCVLLAATLRLYFPANDDSVEIFAGVPRSHPPLSRETEQTLRSLRVRTGYVTNPLASWDASYLVGNKMGNVLQAFANGCSIHATHVVQLDTDVVLRRLPNLSEILDDEAVVVPVAGHADGSRAAPWQKMYAHFGRDVDGGLQEDRPNSSSSSSSNTRRPEQLRSVCTDESMPPYFSAGIVSIPRHYSSLPTLWIHVARALAQDMRLGAWSWGSDSLPSLSFFIDQYSLAISLVSSPRGARRRYRALERNRVHCVLNCATNNASKIALFDDATFVHYQQFRNLCVLGDAFEALLLRANREVLGTLGASLRVRLEGCDEDSPGASLVLSSSSLKEEEDTPPPKKPTPTYYVTIQDPAVAGRASSIQVPLEVPGTIDEASKYFCTKWSDAVASFGECVESISNFLRDQNAAAESEGAACGARY
eukprot:g2792.t1